MSGCEMYVNLSKTSMVMVGSYALFGYLCRVMSFLIYFTPSFGLFSCLAHYQAEQIPWRTDRSSSVPEMYGSGESWNKINRFDYCNVYNKKPPTLTLYTVLTLKQYFVGFWCIMLLQLIAVFMAKRILSPKFRKPTVGWFDKLTHCIENSNLAYPMEDWDYERSGKCAEHIKRMKAVEKEVFVTMIINLIFNAILISPMAMLRKYTSVIDSLQC